MSFPTYDGKKQSDFEWLGEVPLHWEVFPLKRLLDIQNGADHKAVEVDEGYPVIGSGGVFAFASDFLYDGESVLLGRKGTIDKPLYVTGKFWTVDTMYWSIVRPDVCGRFAYYASTTIPFGLYSTSTALPSMTKAALNEHRVAFPPLPEQRTIASFLDTETSKIDGLVSEQRRLIELLKEKRQAVISHAVTKGLNPDVKMKPSGVEWLGEVPQHWDVSRIKYLCYVNDGNHGEEYPNESDYTSEDDGVPFIRGGNLDSENLTITAENMLYITKEKNDSMRKGNVRTNDILFVNRGDIGKLAVIPPDFEGANLNSQIAYLRTEGSVYYRYLVYFLCSKSISNLIDSLKAGSVLTQFPIRDIINIAVPLPQESEQHEIADWLDARIGAFSQLQAQAERAIELLQERRTALISAAVTGKIDVRGYKPEESVA